jgi:hypothetical protein
LRAVDESMPIKLIFDTDPGVDDAAALLFLNACKSIKLLGITTVFGNADIEDGDPKRALSKIPLQDRRACGARRGKSPGRDKLSRSRSCSWPKWPGRYSCQ